VGQSKQQLCELVLGVLCGEIVLHRTTLVFCIEQLWRCWTYIREERRLSVWVATGINKAWETDMFKQFPHSV
jgi:hypothetical protein